MSDIRRETVMLEIEYDAEVVPCPMLWDWADLTDMEPLGYLSNPDGTGAWMLRDYSVQTSEEEIS